MRTLRKIWERRSEMGLSISLVTGGMLLSGLPGIGLGALSLAATGTASTQASAHKPALMVRKVVYKNSRLDFKAQLPQLVGNSPAIQSANREIREVVYGSLAGYRKPTDETGLYSVELSYKAPVATSYLLGLVFEEYSYLEHSAHPMTTHRTLNLDLATGKAVALPELFTSGAPVLEIVSTASRPLVSKHFEGDIPFEEGLKPVPENFCDWLVTPAGLRVIFDPYQVGPYAAGPVTVTLPWSSLPQLRRERVESLLLGSKSH